ncbi:MAG: hypothetical protein KJZ78_21025 [Bryobacteraceae bacterium]|nr:hypothetical protein [Bryobacteraceae bacterium]
MPSVRIYQKKEIRLDRLNFRQHQMFKIGNVGVAAVKNRVMAAQGPDDGHAKPLTKRYAIRKTKLGKGNRRNLYFTGDMLRNFMVRTVSEKQAKASLSTRKDRIKAWANQKIQQWAVFSPKNRQALIEATRRVVAEMVPRLTLQRSLGGKQR